MLVKDTSKTHCFTDETENAITAYNNETDFIKRDEIYSNKIYESLSTLSSIVFSKFNLPYKDRDEILNDIVSELTINLYKWKPDGNRTAFVFFYQLAKWHLIALSRKYRGESLRAVDFELDERTTDILYQNSVVLDNNGIENDILTQQQVSLWKDLSNYVMIFEKDNAFSVYAINRIQQVFDKKEQIPLVRYAQDGREIKSREFPLLAYITQNNDKTERAVTCRKLQALITRFKEYNRTTMMGDTRITEDGNYRITE